MTVKENYSEEIEIQKPARPMKVVKDQKGVRWLCDQDVDTNKNLGEQGCWQCGDEHFAMNRDD